MTNIVQALTSAAMISALCITPVSLLSKTDLSEHINADFNSSIYFKVGNCNL
jgi:hypothetical protein